MKRKAEKCLLPGITDVGFLLRLQDVKKSVAWKWCTKLEFNGTHTHTHTYTGQGAETADMTKRVHAYLTPLHIWHLAMLIHPVIR